MEEIKKRIGGLSDKQIAEIAKTFGVTGKTVYNALTFDADRGWTEKAKRIRRFAELKGGYVVVTVPISEMMHDADGHMRQYYRNGVMLDCDKSTGLVKIINKDGIDVFDFYNPPISMLPEIQKTANGLR